MTRNGAFANVAREIDNRDFHGVSLLLINQGGRDAVADTHCVRVRASARHAQGDGGNERDMQHSAC
jgi:hypothetical protein